ncbi:Thiolase-like protein [Stemphylium lycopersici]|uniref:Thiolase-like protein n=1 Tax=Stemphylium lycopersici TaxID=183478 RepID=A0A364MXE4_STELY|nr:Thiolase-like protein [Stemphylium lycopersici]RAR05720.1 Thiolase-like protein [Stemphylium lycopersici]
MSLDDFNKVVNTKILGSIHLHELLPDHDLDFVMTSSVLGAIGAAMQSNYSAANAYLDHMARHLRSIGLQVMSMARGMIVDVGHVEEHPEVEKALKPKGLYEIFVHEYLTSMELACRRQDLGSPIPHQSPFRCDVGAAAHIVTGVDPTRLSRAVDKSLWLKDNRLRNIIVGLGDTAGNEEHHSESATGIDAGKLLEGARTEGGVAAVTNVVLGLILASFSKLVLLPVEKMDPGKTLASYGIDSAISTGLKSWARREFAVDFPFLALFDQGLTFDCVANQVIEIL